MKKFLILPIILFLSGCDENRRPEAMASSSNKTYQVDRLFEVDGCKVYRFYDDSYYRYFTSCSGTSASTVSCGKNCTLNNTIQTSAEPIKPWQP